MPYARRDTTPWIPGHYYHIYNRGVQKTTLFREEDNYLYVLQKLRHYSDKLKLSIIAYCLMPNHYHFLVRQNGDNPAGLLPQQIFNAYTKAYNNRYDESGTLFDRRYQAKPIESTAHLLHLCRYIHANPVKDGIVDCLENWPYSNYLDWIGQKDGVLVDSKFIREHFQSSQDYLEFVSDYLRTRNLPDEINKHLAEFER